jgi:hypothetical protein
MLPSGRKLEVRLACWSWSGSAGWACPFGIDASDVLQGRPDDHMEMFVMSRNLLIGLFTIGNTFFQSVTIYYTNIVFNATAVSTHNATYASAPLSHTHAAFNSTIQLSFSKQQYHFLPLITTTYLLY